MTLGDWVTLGVLAAIVGAIWLGRRHGRASRAAALASASAVGYAAGRADLTAELQSLAAAAATARVDVGGIHVHGGRVGPADRPDNDYLEHDDDADDGRTLHGGGGLRELPPVRTRIDGAGVVPQRVGGVLDGVQRGPDEGSPHRSGFLRSAPLDGARARVVVPSMRWQA